MMEFITALPGLIVEWMDVALAIVGAFALIATRTNNTTDDRIGQVLLDIINFLGANFGKASNPKDAA